MGSSSSKQTTTTTVNEDYIFGHNQGGAQVGAADTVVNNITSADPTVMRDALAAMESTANDAFSQGFGFGSIALDSMADTASNAMSANSDTMARALASIENQSYWSGQAITQALGTVKSIGTGGATDMAEVFKYTAMAAAVVVAIFAFRVK